MKKAKAYMRMSTDKQEHSIESQWRLIEEYANRNGYKLIGKYEDEGISGRAAEKRPAFMQMIEDSESGDFEAVIIYDSSRFARNLKDAIVYKSILKKNGVDLISITEPILDDDTGLITDALMGAMNEMYSRKLSKNVKRGQEQKVLRGEIFSLPPFGYRRTLLSKNFVIEESEAEVVRYIYEQFISGKSVYSLARELSQTEIRTRRGNRFDMRQVDRILINPVYKGWMDVVVNDVRYNQKSNHPEIISEDVFEEAQKIMKEKITKKGKRQRPPEVRTHWLSGKVRCENCGGAYFRRANGHGHNPNFTCCNYAKAKCIGSPMILQSNLERQFLEAAKLFAQNGESYNISVEKRQLSEKPDYSLSITKLEQSLKRAKEAFLSGIDTMEEYRLTKDRITKEIEKIKADQNAPELEIDYEKLKQNLFNLIELIESPDSALADKQKAIDKIVKNVIIHKDRSITVLFYSE